MIKEDKKCIVRNKNYNFYYYGGAMYGNDLFKAIFEYNQIPKEIKNNPEEEVIFLDSKEGLKLMIDEIHRLHDYISNEEPRLNESKKSLENLSKFDLVQKYLERYNKINPLIREPTEQNKKGIIDAILASPKV